MNLFSLIYIIRNMKKKIEYDMNDIISKWE